MGIQGLLPVLRSITHKVSIAKYAGKRVAVDAYCWLHKGAYCCSKELCEGGSPDKCTRFCMQRVALLKRAGVEPVLVFDGGRLNMKAMEEGSRAKSRQDHLERARAHSVAGNTAAAYECYQRAVDIAPETALALIKALQGAEVEYVVAPYEADAQMAYLALTGDVDAVLTEDSDLLPYGCQQVLLKMDQHGSCEEICMRDIAQNRELSFVGFSPAMFQEMCIMAGCDFLKAIPSIGIRKAHAHMRSLKSFPRVCKSMRFKGVSVPPGYEQAFQRALWTFNHQTVFCPKTQACVPLRPFPGGGLLSSAQVPMSRGQAAADCQEGCDEDGNDSLSFLGAMLDAATARGIASGRLNPLTRQPFPEQAPVVLQPLELNITGHSRASGHAPPAGVRKLLPVQANGISNYFSALPASNKAVHRDFAAPRQKVMADPPPADALCSGSDAYATAPKAQADAVKPPAQPGGLKRKRSFRRPLSAYCFSIRCSSPEGESQDDHMDFEVDMPHLEPQHRAQPASDAVSQQLLEQAEGSEASISLGDLADPGSLTDDETLHDACLSGEMPLSPRATNSRSLHAEQLCRSPLPDPGQWQLQLGSPHSPAALPLDVGRHQSDMLDSGCDAEHPDQDSLSLGDSVSLQMDESDDYLTAAGSLQYEQYSSSMLGSSGSQGCMALQALHHQPRHVLGRHGSAQPSNAAVSQPECTVEDDDMQREPGLSPKQPHPWAMLTADSARMPRPGSGSVASGLRRAGSQPRARSMSSKRGRPDRRLLGSTSAAAGTAASAASNSCRAGSQHQDVVESEPVQGTVDEHPVSHRAEGGPSFAGQTDGATVQGAEPPSASGSFHSMQHVQRYAVQAASALDRLQHRTIRRQQAGVKPALPDRQRIQAASQRASASSAPRQQIAKQLSKFACKSSRR